MSAYVFPSPDGVPYIRVHVSRMFCKATRGAGLRDFHFHDLPTIGIFCNGC